MVQQCIAIIDKQASALDLLNIWGNLTLVAICLPILFLVNGGGRGKNFITKFFAFSITVGYKYAIAFILLNLYAKFITSTYTQTYQISVYVILNILMVANIALRMYQTRI
jgi:hypothetical protein